MGHQPTLGSQPTLRCQPTLGHQPILMNTDLEHWDVITDCQHWESVPSLTPKRQHWAPTLSENTGEH